MNNIPVNTEEGKTLLIGETLHLFYVSGNVNDDTGKNIAFFSCLVLADTGEYAKSVVYKRVAEKWHRGPIDMVALRVPLSTIKNVLHYADWHTE